jgi:hypothetical protein
MGGRRPGGFHPESKKAQEAAYRHTQRARQRLEMAARDRQRRQQRQQQQRQPRPHLLLDDLIWEDLFDEQHEHEQAVFWEPQPQPQPQPHLLELHDWFWNLDEALLYGFRNLDEAFLDTFGDEAAAAGG